MIVRWFLQNMIDWIRWPSNKRPRIIKNIIKIIYCLSHRKLYNKGHKFSKRCIYRTCTERATSRSTSLTMNLKLKTKSLIFKFIWITELWNYLRSRLDSWRSSWLRNKAIRNWEIFSIIYIRAAMIIRTSILCRLISKKWSTRNKMAR